jgi:Villin headpiece domain/Gelsolin repeat
MKGHAALLANELDPRRVIKQARIVQGAETNSFIDIFGESKTIMLVKKNASEGMRLFQIQEYVSKRIKIQEQSLNNRFHACASFLVLNGDVATIWKSKLTSSDLVSRVSKFVSSRMQLKKVDIVDEGSEPLKFWSDLGLSGQQVFVPAYYNQVKSLPIKTRLFRISSIKLGNATADEIEQQLHQSSFLANGVFILDAYYELYVWLGNEICQSKESKHELIKLALETALEYCDVVKEQESRLERSDVYLIRQGQEPLGFKSLFLDWKDWTTSDGYYQSLPRTYSFILNEKKVTDCLSEMATKKWSLYDLQQMLAQRIPIGLDPKRLQDYLVETEFEEYIGMERSAFEALPEWRKIAMRRKIGLV